MEETLGRGGDQGSERPIRCDWIIVPLCYHCWNDCYSYLLFGSSGGWCVAGGRSRPQEEEEEGEEGEREEGGNDAAVT